MLGAMGADGKIHEAELASMQRHLEEHEMFSGLSDRQHAVLLQIARDSITFASSPVARIPGIAKGLPSRLHKLTALAMACEVVVADTEIDPTEEAYLDTLRCALRISVHEFAEIFRAAREKRSTRDLDARVTHLRELVPTIVELFALRSLGHGILTPAHRAEIVELLAALPDLEVRGQELAALVQSAYERMHFSMDLEVELHRIAAAIPGAIDRYWATVYLMCANTVSAPLWRSSPFLTLVQRIFALSDADLDLAATDAAGFASLLPRVG
jgi:tellurite resistance protein